MVADTLVMWFVSVCQEPLQVNETFKIQICSVRKDWRQALEALLKSSSY